MRHALMRVFACAVLATVSGLQSTDARAAATLTVDIPAQPLAAALSEFARQTGLQLLYVTQVAKAQTSKGAPAGLPASDTLTELLQGTGLRFEFLNDRTVRIFEPPITGPTAGSIGTAAAPAPRVQRPATPLWADMDEIDVTARRSEGELTDYIQGVPVSVSVVSGETLAAQHSERLVDYAFSVPGVNSVTAGGPGQDSLIVRGIANGVSFYIDDIAIDATALLAGAGGSLALDLMPYELQRFEVWRGPQGTVSGADSQIGLIRYAFRRADVNDFQANVGADIISIHGAERPGETIHAAINVPVVEGKLGVRGSFEDSYAPGYIDNLYSGEQDINPVRERAGRITALWQPAESLSVTVSALWSRITSPWWSEVNVRGVEIVPNSGDAYLLQPTGFWGDLVTNQAFPEANGRGIDLYSASLKWTSGSWEVHSATGWQRSSAYFQFDATPTNGIYFPDFSGGVVPPGLSLERGSQNGEKFTQEMRIGSSRERLHWTVGGFYTSQSLTSQDYLHAFDKSYQPITFWGPFVTFDSLAPRFREQVLFGDLSGQITRHFELSGGARYAHDSQSFEHVSSDYISGTSYHSGQFSESAPSWRLAGKYQFTPDLMLYGQIATGFFPGASPPPARGETLTNYESGVKTLFFEGKGLVDVTVYDVVWRDIQVGTANGFVNGAHATSKGLELISSYTTSHGLRLAYNAAYTRAAFDSVIPAADVNLTGYQFNNVPKWAMSGSLEYRWDLRDLWHASVAGAARSIGREFSSGNVQSRSLNGYPATILPGYSVIDLNTSVATGSFTARLFVRNLADKRAYLNGVPVVDVAPTPNPVQILYKLVQPRTIGIGFDYTL